MNVGAVRGISFIEASLRKIQINKEYIIHEIEMGNEILIPMNLSQDHLPISFRYYDPILKIVKANLNPAKKGYYIIKK